MFPTERQVYHRLRWDPRFDVRRCAIVIRERAGGTQRVAFADFDAEVVPWHRIVEFWIDDQLVWSRPQRIDRLDALAGAAGDVEPPPVRPLPPGRWTVASRPAGPLRVATWNLLFDRHDADLLRSPERWADAIARLGTLDADVIALVEVTPAIWERVLAARWVAGYAPVAGTLEPYGEALLVRHPIRDAGVVDLPRRRTALVATLDVAGQAIGVAAVHLTSDRSADAALVRDSQLAGVLAHVRATPRDAWLIAGDFNAPPDALLAGTIDVWPDGPPTFDVEHNALAAAMSSSGRSGRYDRIHAIGLAPTSARLFGTEPGPSGLPPSDHYGVIAELVPAAVAAPLTRRTAVALIPPREVWGSIQRIRCTHDRGFARWPPHLTLARPFVDEPWLGRAAAVMRDRFAAIAPFELALEPTAQPIEPGSRTIVLVPDRAGGRAIAKLREAIEPAPVDDRPFRPHLTVARDVEPRTLPALPATWRVDRVALLAERDGRFEVVEELALGGVSLARRDVPAPDHVPAASMPHEVSGLHDAAQPHVGAVPRSTTLLAADLAAVTARIAAIDPGATVTPFGSAVYAPEHARDLDLLVETDLTAAQLGAALGLAAAGSDLRGSIAGRAIDLAISPRAAPDPRALAGPRDVAYLVEHLRAHGRDAAFRAAWPEVRRFVQLRALGGGNGLGYLGSFGWALLLAIPLCHDATLCASRDVLADWFGWLAQLAPGAAVGFTGVAPAASAPLWLAAPTPPARNAARGLTAGSFAVVRDEARRAARGAAVVELADEPPAGVRFAIAGARGAYEGAARGLLLELEAIGLAVRSWGRIEPGGRHQISVAPAERVTDATRCIEEWLAKTVPGAHLVPDPH